MHRFTQGSGMGRRTRLSADKPVGEVLEGWRSHPSSVSVSALFDPRVVDMGGELLHVSVPLQRVLIQLNLFPEVYDGSDH